METLLTEGHEEVLLVRLNRPRRRNAITGQLLSELDSLLDDVEADEGIRAVAITGNEQAFCAGQDLKEPEQPSFERDINELYNRIEAFPKPVIAAIDGWCLAGGLELALTCDMRICSEEAQIGDWHARINSIGGAGATVRLVRLLGLARAKELVFTGAALAGPQALKIGLVSHVYPRAELIDRAIEHARSFCTGNPVTVRYAKQSLNAAADLTLADALRHSLLCQRAVRSALDESYTESFSRGGGKADSA